MNAEAAQHALWRHGQLAWLLHSDQERVRASICRLRHEGHRMAVVLASRRWGKSKLGTVLSNEQCVQQPGSIVPYAAPTQKMVRSIVAPHIRDVIQTAPSDMRPEERIQEGTWVHPNGSEIRAWGVDAGGADRGRGTSADLGVIDEAGFVTDLRYLVKSVMLPMLLTTDGFLLFISSPSITPAHDFAEICAEAEAKGALIKRTIYDAPHITAAMRDEFIAELGGLDATATRRELLCEFVTDDSAAVVPEFSRHEAAIVQECELPEHFDAYVSLDVGFFDLSFAVFGVTDFRNARTLILNEWSGNKNTSDIIDANIASIERATWGDHPVRQRVVDAGAIEIAELNKNARPRGATWGLARKDDAEAALNDLRISIAQHRLIIHPRCRQLIAHLRHAVWANGARRTYERSPDHGHFDGVDAAKYLVRTVDLRKNPYPELPPGTTPDTHHIRASRKADPMNAIFRPLGARQR